MGVFSFVKAGGKKFGSIVGTGPKVNKTKIDEAKSALAKSTQNLKGATAKLKQTQFEIKNKLPITFPGRSKKKTESNTEKAKRAFKKEDKNFNKGGRVGLRFGTPKPKTNVDKIKKAFPVNTKVKFDAKKSDLDKSGSLSPYEKKRGMAIAKAMAKKNKKV